MKLMTEPGCASHPTAMLRFKNCHYGDLLDTRSVMSLVLLNNHVQLSEKLAELKSCDLVRDLNLPALGDYATPLIWAACENCSENVVEVLLRNGADPKIRRYGFSGRGGASTTAMV